MERGLLKIESVSKSYRRKGDQVRHALAGVDLELRLGEIVALLGLNGAGKTTLSSIIATLTPPSSGRLSWNGCSIYSALCAYRSIVGLCPQYQNLDPHLTLEQNLLFQGRYYGLRGHELYAAVEKLLKNFELEPYARLSAEELSGGYKQRFLIARALIHSPKLVILDEPTVGLDPQARRHLWHHICSLRDTGACVLLTTHYLDEAEILADRVCKIGRAHV